MQTREVDDRFTCFGLAKEPSYPNFGLGNHDLRYENSIRVKSNKLIVSEADMDEAIIQQKVQGQQC